MADSDSETTNSTESHSSKTKSTKVQNFVLLKQILDDETIEITDSDELQTNEKGIQSNEGRNSVKKSQRDQDLCSPIGKYPVTFSKRCKSKSCQTRLSAFPLFPVPDDTEWISEEEESAYFKKEKQKPVGKKKAHARKRRNSSNEENKKDKEAMERLPETTKNADGTRKDFHSEHQLKDTKNPIIQAWIQSKNKLARKTRREERKEKKAQRTALQEEERLKLERLETSEKKVKEWFKFKRKEARKLWRQNHPRVSPFEMTLDNQMEASPPPPEYKIFKTFKQNHSSSKCSSVCTNLKANGFDTAKVVDTAQIEDISDNKPDYKLPTQLERPKTARHARPVEKMRKHRPKTAKVASKCEDAVSKEKPLKLIKSLSYDEWLKSKRELDKKKVIERRRELIDSHLDTVISKLGKQRVDNIVSPRKHVDTGLKNFSQNTSKFPSPQKKESYKWRTRHDAQRPEPQGCDCPEAVHVDFDNKFNVNLSLSNPRTRANEFCKEVTDKCDELKPSIDKVLAILDSEVKKCSTEKQIQSKTSKNPGSIVSTANATCDDNENYLESYSVPGTVDENRHLSRPKSAHPKSRKTNLVNNTTLTTEEAKKKILHDMDVLGLCHSDENLGNISLTTEDNKVSTTTYGIQDSKVAMTTAGDINKNVAKLPDEADIRSTVRSDYFDYGTDMI